MTSHQSPSSSRTAGRTPPSRSTGGRAGKADRTPFRCTECGFNAAKWLGRCPECQAWGTLAETAAGPAPLRRLTPAMVTTPAVPIAEVPAGAVRARPSGLTELDRVLGGGLVPGGVVLLAGEPGVGKSTLLLSAAHAWAAGGQGRVLIVSGEESAAQIRMRADRMQSLHPELYLAAESDLGAVLGQIEAVRPALVVLDSVQTIASGEIEGSAGGVAQVRAVAAALTAAAKEHHFACVLIGHVTKDGAIAGPRVLEHLVDVVLQFEGDRHSSLRLIRGVKNRFGPSDEVGCFQMVADGIVGLADPSGVFLSGRRDPVPGTCATVAMQGRRPLPVEIQALVADAGGEHGRRTASGLDAARMTMVMAVLQRWGGVALANREVLAATVGGVRVTEPGVDLALAMALWSSARDIALPPGLVVLGELGLSAEVRPPPALSRRLVEARRLGFDHAIVPAGGEAGTAPQGLRVDRVTDLGQAFRSLGNDDGVVHWLQQRR
ncbi:DNA repair protein RadA [Nakamurella leprariae]|uniref:DNA repair protein RadA n=1 Tax=Nakamurella leprariae TaxID=2803911 RepID=A0A938YD74_9ACTN|nr:DNA repair protein RadA [Nakamurella leprariae]MBM9466297.1 DNA repair protein RadA [Nakamurella leprariae]